MNINLYELDSGELVDLREIESISEVIGNDPDQSRWFFHIHMKSGSMYHSIWFDNKDNAELARFKLVERWGNVYDLQTGQYDEKSGCYFNTNQPEELKVKEGLIK